MFLRSASVFASWTAVSRLLGFVRDILLAVTLGATPIADAFLFAYRFPHLFRHLLAEGALSAALVPIYQQRRQHAVRRTHQYLSGSLLLSLLVTTLMLSVALALLMPSVVATLARGFLAFEATFLLTVDLSRIAIFYLPLIATTALLCAVLSAHGYFALYGAMPVLLNAALIVVLLPASFLDISPESLAFTLLATLLAAGVLQSLLAYEGCRRIDAQPLLLAKPPTAAARRHIGSDRKAFMALFLSALGGHGFVQISFLVNQYFASQMGEGVIASLYYAERLLQLPIGIVAVAMASVLLPEVARLRALGDERALEHTQNQAFSMLLVIAIPSALGLSLLAEPIVATLFQYGAFDEVATERASHLLAILACALPAFTMLRPLLAVLFAHQQARLVLVLSFLSLLLNVWLASTLTPLLGYEGIAFAVAIAAWCNMSATLAAVLVKGYWCIRRSFLTRLAKILFASMVLAASLLALRGIVPQPEGFVHAWQRGSVLAVLIAASVLVYILSVVLLRVFSLQELRQWFSKQKA